MKETLSEKSTNIIQSRNLSLTAEGINLLRDLNLHTLLQRKKIELVLDLDNTLIHAINADILKSATKGSVDDDDDEILNGETVVKLRPGVGDFLENVTKLFHLSISTRADEPYAREIAKILESESNVQFSRVISREAKMFKKSLDRLCCHQRVVLIVDDVDTIWKQEDRANLIKIKPYTYFNTRSSASGSDDDHELARVWGVLKAIHSAFYDKTAAAKDVRPLLEMVKMAMWLDSRACNSSQHQHH